MKRNRTNQRPLFDIMRPGSNLWTWEVTYKVSQSGYVNEAHVLARRFDADDPMAGSASCMVEHDMHLNEVLEFLAVEAMLAACEPTLFDTKPHRYTAFVASTF